jgi:SAM-dependent methyltransferase
MGLPELQAFIAKQLISSISLTALGAALEAKATGSELDPKVAALVREMLVQVGASELVDGVGPQEAGLMAAMIRTFYSLDGKLLHASKRTTTWNHAEPEILQSIGVVARVHAQSFTRVIVPACEGLAARLSAPSASLLDVGVGVAGTAISLAQMWPELRIVGIDPWQPSLRLARENVAEANLESRIELREQGVEALADRARYDAVYFAAHFIPEQSARPGLQRVLQALRPGGWLATAASFERLPPPVLAMNRLRESQWGGAMWTADQTEQVLREHGYVDLARMEPQSGPPVTWIVARRPE